MPTSNSDAPNSDSSTLDLAQALKEIARGEQTAATLESNLSSLEAKLDAMLAGLEQQEKDKSQTSANGGPETDAQEKKEIQDEEKELKMDLEETDELKAIKAKQGEMGKGTFQDK